MGEWLRAGLVRWGLLLGGGLALAVPFKYAVLPSMGVALWRLLAAGDAAALVSDSGAQWAAAGGWALASLALAGAWAALARRHPAAEARLWYGLHTGAAWFLALHLLKYGFDKVFKLQLYLPEPNTLYTPLGELPPDLAYWSVMGTSRFYSVFAGLAEVVPGLLLLWGRTRRLGGVWALAVLANVLALNIGFDISVKLWAGFLLGLAALVAAPALAPGLRMLRGSGGSGSGAIQPGPARPAAWRGRWMGALRGLGLGLLLAETAGPALLSGTLNDDTVPRPPLHGAYAVLRQWPEAPGAAGLARVFVHRRGYFITQTLDGHFQDYPLTYRPGALLLGPADTLRCRVAGDTLELRGTLGGRSVRLLARALPWRQLPLLRGW